jgi:hypothetical protein
MFDEKLTGGHVFLKIPFLYANVKKLRAMVRLEKKTRGMSLYQVVEYRSNGRSENVLRVLRCF